MTAYCQCCATSQNGKRAELLEIGQPKLPGLAAIISREHPHMTPAELHAGAEAALNAWAHGQAVAWAQEEFGLPLDLDDGMLEACGGVEGFSVGDMYQFTGVVSKHGVRSMQAASTPAPLLTSDRPAPVSTDTPHDIRDVASPAPSQIITADGMGPHSDSGTELGPSELELLQRIQQREAELMAAEERRQWEMRRRECKAQKRRFWLPGLRKRVLEATEEGSTQSEAMLSALETTLQLFSVQERTLESILLAAKLPNPARAVTKAKITWKWAGVVQAATPVNVAGVGPPRLIKPSKPAGVADVDAESVNGTTAMPAGPAPAGEKLSPPTAHVSQSSSDTSSSPKVAPSASSTVAAQVGPQRADADPVSSSSLESRLHTAAAMNLRDMPSVLRWVGKPREMAMKVRVSVW